MLETILTGVSVAVAVAFVGFGARGYLMLCKLVSMHESPDAYGFGTIALSTVIKENAQASERNAAASERLAETMEDFDTVLRWVAESISDGKMPPLRIKRPRASG